MKSFTFGIGSHPTREQGMCVMEAVAYLAGEPHSDHPQCACPVVTRLAIWVNDSCGDALRQELLQGLPWRIVGTKASPEIELQRGYMAADWAVRVVAPTMLRQAGFTENADRLAGLPPVIDKASALAARAAAYAAAYAAYAAADAACAAARAAAGAAAYAAAYAAYAAADAACAAARAAADAACAAEYDLESLQRSCVDLIDRMIRLTEPQEVVPVRLQNSVAG